MKRRNEADELVDQVYAAFPPVKLEWVCGEWKA